MAHSHHPDRKKAQAYLSRYSQNGIPHLIGGVSVDSAAEAVFENHTPLDNTHIGHVAMGESEDINRAVFAAKEAFPAWRDMPATERKALLHAVADLIESNSDEIALLEVLDTGQTIKYMSKAAERAADNFRFFADRAESARDGLALPADGHLNYTMRQPVGPVGIITPWNTPFMLSTWKIAPALAAGCTIVHKPAEWSPVTAMRLAELIHEAGIPPGVVNVVNGIGEVAGKALTEHPDIKAIGFVGDSETGKAIMRQGSDTLKRVHFELGGKNPVVVFADSDLERALDAVLFMIFSLNGERCTASSRLLVERGIYDDFIARLVDRMRNLRVGDPFDKSTDIGPLIHPTHLEKVMNYVTLGCEEGATLASGGQRPDGLGYGNYFEPTLFTAATGDMRIAQEEVFGPFLTALSFDSEEEALALANNTKYGLAAYLWTGDVRRAHTFSQQLDAGMIWVNSQNVRYLPTPFGGMKSSGIGRDGGDYSFDFYMETKNIDVALGDHRIPKLG